MMDDEGWLGGRWMLICASPQRIAQKKLFCLVVPSMGQGTAVTKKGGLCAAALFMLVKQRVHDFLRVAKICCFQAVERLG
jgi:hypothetical protein